MMQTSSGSKKIHRRKSKSKFKFTSKRNGQGMCHRARKVIYRTRKSALTVIAYMSKRRENRGKRFGVYKCPDCKQFHITSHVRGLE